MSGCFYVVITVSDEEKKIHNKEVNLQRLKNTCIEIVEASLKTIWLRSLSGRKTNTGKVGQRHRGVCGVPPPQCHSVEMTFMTLDVGSQMTENRTDNRLSSKSGPRSTPARHPCSCSSDSRARPRACFPAGDSRTLGCVRSHRHQLEPAKTESSEGQA